MSWVKLDDQFFRHPKAVAVGRDGRALFLAGLCWCASNLTDGRIPKEALRMVAAEAEVRRNTAEKLTKSGLWHEESDAYVVHAYLDFNPSRLQVESEREAARQRMLRVRGNRRSSPELLTEPRPEHPSNFGRSAPSPVPSRPLDIQGGTDYAGGEAGESDHSQGFDLTEELRTWARERLPGADVDLETEKFLAHHEARGSTFADWGAAWRKWMLQSRTASNGAPPVETCPLCREPLGGNHTDWSCRTSQKMLADIESEPS